MFYKRPIGRPDPKMEEWLRAHLDDCGTPGEVVECRLFLPVFSELSEEQLSYYLYWRDRVLNGEYIPSGQGYIHILLFEILIRNPDPSEVERICHLLDSNLSMGLTDISPMFLFDYQITHGVNPNYPVYEHSYDGIYRTYGALSNLLTHPQSDIPPHFTRLIANKADIYTRGLDIDTLAKDLSIALRAVGDLLARRGTGILEEFGDGRKIIVREVFQDYSSYHGERHYILDYTDMDMDGRAGQFLTGILRTVMKVRGIKDDDKDVTVPAYITKEMRKVVKDALLGKTEPIIGSKGPDLGFSSVSEYISRDDTLVVPLTEFLKYSPSGALRTDIDVYHDREPGPPMDYIPSRIKTPEYAKLKDGRLDYYIQWRAGVRNGIYGRTDEGYIWLLMTELLNSGDPQKSMDTMLGLREAYDPYHCNIELGKGILIHSIYHGLDIPSTDVCDDDPNCIGRVLYQIDRGREGEITLRSFETIASQVSKKPVAGFDRSCSRVMNKVLRRVAEERRGMADRDDRTSFGHYLSVRILLKNFTQFRFYKFEGNERTLKMETQSVDDNFICDDLRNLMTECAGMMQEIRAGKTYEMRKTTFARVEIERILTEEIRNEIKASEERYLTKQAEARADIDLDRDAVDNAEKDLETVTDMMKVEDPAEPVIEERRVDPKKDDDDPWSSFMSSLTDDERRHLDTILRGPPKTDVRMDDSINAKAMDSVGDTVIEDGSVIGEYRQELEERIPKNDVPKRVTATDEEYRRFETTLTGPDREYIIKLASGKHMMGRKPERRILSINCKAVLNIGSDLIINGKIVPEHLRWAKTLKDRN